MMRKPSETQNRIVERISRELENSGLRILENVTGLVDGSPTEDVYRYLRAEKRFEIYVYEDGEADVSGPERKRVFELPDFDSPAELEESLVEEIVLQARPGELPGTRYQKLENRRRSSQLKLVVTIVIIAVGSFLVWLKSQYS